MMMERRKKRKRVITTINPIITSGQFVAKVQRTHVTQIGMHIWQGCGSFVCRLLGKFNQSTAEFYYSRRRRHCILVMATRSNPLDKHKRTKVSKMQISSRGFKGAKFRDEGGVGGEVNKLITQAKEEPLRWPKWLSRRCKDELDVSSRIMKKGWRGWWWGGKK